MYKNNKPIILYTEDEKLLYHVHKMSDTYFDHEVVQDLYDGTVSARFFVISIDHLLFAHLLGAKFYTKYGPYITRVYVK